MTKPKQQHNNFNEIIQDIQNLTAFHADLGLEYPHDDALDYLLNKEAGKTKPAPKSLISLQKKSSAPQDTQPSTNRIKRPVTAVSQTDIDNSKQLVKECNSCPHRKPPKFGVGTTDHPYIFIICDGNSTDPSRPMEEAEESLLGKMLQAIKIKPPQIFVTNLIKCKALDNNAATQVDMATNCLNHIRQQIRLMQPLMICTMGQLSSQTVLQSKNQLMALRGHFHTFMDIPLMATYHPAQLLTLPELKKATWYDLQLMQRKLATGE